MWMQELRLDDGTVLQAYKHEHTRCYLYLSNDGEAYESLPCDTFLPFRLDYALEEALCTWWFLDGWDEEIAEAVKSVILAANAETRDHPRPLRKCGVID